MGQPARQGPKTDPRFLRAAALGARSPLPDPQPTPKACAEFPAGSWEIATPIENRDPPQTLEATKRQHGIKKLP